jgi:hypothetical protein
VNVEREIDRLYGLPLEEFTAARNDLAKSLAKDGDKAAAAQVKALEKPTAAAWAMNQLQRRDEVGMKRLLSAADKLRDVQTGAKAGNLREATQTHYDAVEALVAAARRLLGDAVTDPVLNRLGPALLNGSVDPDARERLRAGRMVREPEATGFDAFAGVSIAPRKDAGPSPAEEARREREASRERAKRAELQAAKKELAGLEKAARDAAREADAAEHAAEAARKRVARLEAK